MNAAQYLQHFDRISEAPDAVAPLYSRSDSRRLLEAVLLESLSGQGDLVCDIGVV